MSFTMISPYQKLSKKQVFQLFWYMKMVAHNGNDQFCYLEDYHIFESFIHFYNSLITNFSIASGSVKELLQQQNIYDVDDADIKNILLSLQASFNTPTADCYQFSVEAIRQQVAFYAEWFRYFSYLYDHDYNYRAKPVIWDISRKYDDHTIVQLERGYVMELYIDDELQKYGVNIGLYYDPDHQYAGESLAGIEIKHDIKSQKTGNYYIEYAERHTNSANPNFVPSGIMKRSNTIFWVIGVPREYYFVREADLRNQLFKMDPNNPNWQDGKKYVASGTSLGYIIQRSKLRELAVADSVEKFLQKFSQIHARFCV